VEQSTARLMRKVIFKSLTKKMKNAQQSFLATNWFKIFIAGFLLLIIAIYFYRESQLNDCLSNVYESQTEKWDQECAKEKKKAGCELTNLFVANGLNIQTEKSVDMCYRRHGFEFK
jgi:hypothetical protein